ncbi:MAG: hypothetical protein JW997_00540 [Actinobacteria bacterium]|nr:hypothetical protein [Actinomycetota bacterium]
MEEKIKTAIEIAMEKAALLEDLSEQEKEEIKNKKRLEPLMAAFYKNNLKPEDLWEKLKNEKPSFLKMVQLNLIDSINFNLEKSEIKRRSNAIIAVESLKKEQKTSAIQQGLSMIESIIKNAEAEKEHVYAQFKKAVENNPQARNRVIEQGGAKVILKLSVEDAISQNPQWKQFISEYEAKNDAGFADIIQRVKDYIT